MPSRMINPRCGLEMRNFGPRTRSLAAILHSSRHGYALFGRRSLVFPLHSSAASLSRSAFFKFPPSVPLGAETGRGCRSSTIFTAGTEILGLFRLPAAGLRNWEPEVSKYSPFFGQYLPWTHFRSPFFCIRRLWRVLRSILRDNSRRGLKISLTLIFASFLRSIDVYMKNCCEICD